MSDVRARSSSCSSSSALAAAVVGVRRLAPAARAEGALRSPDPARAGARRGRRASSRRRRWRGRWRRCSAAACRSSTRSTSPPARSATSTWPGSSTSSATRVREGAVVRGGARSARRLSRRRGQDGGGRRVDRRAAGHAEHGRRLLRRGDRDQHGAVHHARRAGAARRHGHRHRRAAAGALHAALPAELGAVAANGRRMADTDDAAASRRADVELGADDRRRRGRAGAPAGRALPARVRRHGDVPDRPGAVPVDSGRPDAALRLRAVPPRRQDAGDRRLRPDAICR